MCIQFQEPYSTDLQVPADLFIFTKEILEENITFNAVPMSTRLLCV